MSITDEQVKAFCKAFLEAPEFATFKEKVLDGLEAADAAAWSKDITKADKSRSILAKLSRGRTVIAYYTNYENQPYILSKGWRTSETGRIEEDMIIAWRYLPEPPK